MYKWVHFPKQKGYKLIIHCWLWVLFYVPIGRQAFVVLRHEGTFIQLDWFLATVNNWNKECHQSFKFVCKTKMLPQGGAKRLATRRWKLNKIRSTNTTPALKLSNISNTLYFSVYFIIIIFLHSMQMFYQLLEHDLKNADLKDFFQIYELNILNFATLKFRN